MSLQGPGWGALVHDRAAAIANMQMLKQETITNSLNWTATQIGVHLEVLEAYWQNFRHVQRQLRMEFSHIEILMDTNNDAEREALEVYANTKASLQHSKAQLETNSPQVHLLRPSEIKVSTFCGRYTEWAAWRAEFKAKVLDTPLSPADKITLLIGSLSDEAAMCAGQAERLDTIELERIWAKLNRTYDNKYQQVYQHIAKILHIAPIQQTSADRLRSMIDTVDEHLRLLKRFNIFTEHWGPLICVILLDKLDPVTRNQWESRDTLPDMPDLTALLAYLEQRIMAIRNVEQSVYRTQQMPTNSNVSIFKANKSGVAASGAKQRFQPYELRNKDRTITNTQADVHKLPNCPQCGSKVYHPLWRCEAFRTMETTMQLQQLRKWGICEVCLREKHKAADCKKGACPVCKTGRHNSLLCTQTKDIKQVNHVRSKRVRNQHREAL